ncbi:hypothetical protein QBC41DRAFT_306137 [Cercophora samala]|uniref:Uncharacterized protein n=1 Tax=Cercophora samala TaxID=330535 RepID=A0AA39Z8B2_9PEZI|nr:hypothetical protein QBC41DRAFT_306137 [Cercophora samala]
MWDSVSAALRAPCIFGSLQSRSKACGAWEQAHCFALFSAFAVNGFVVPEGTAKGLYYTTYDEADNIVLTPIDCDASDNITRDIVTPRSELEVASASS